MTTEEAFQTALNKVEEIKSFGIEVKCKKVEPDNETILKYGGKPDRISSEKWCRVTFSIVTKEESDLIRQKAKELGQLGISFDSGGGPGSRDWELDWSFRYAAT